MLIDTAVSKFGETNFRPQYLRFWLRAYKAAFFSPWQSCAEEIWFRDCGETLSGVVVTTSSTEKAKLLLERWQASITFPKLIFTYFRPTLDF